MDFPQLTCKGKIWCPLSVQTLCMFYHCKSPISQIPQCASPISHNASFCNRNVHISVTKWCIVGYRTGAPWDLHNRFNAAWYVILCYDCHNMGECYSKEWWLNLIPSKIWQEKCLRKLHLLWLNSISYIYIYIYIYIYTHSPSPWWVNYGVFFMNNFEKIDSF